MPAASSKSIVVFGFNGKGSLSTFVDDQGMVINSLEPRLLPLDQEIKAVGCGKAHTLWVTRDDEIYVAGDNAHGQLGRLPTPRDMQEGLASGPTAPEELSHALLDELSIHHVACGDEHSVLASDDKVVVIGGISAEASPAPSSPGRKLTAPAPLRLVSMPRAVVGLACGGAHTLARLSDGSVMAWGSNSFGQLGLGDFVDRAEPTILPMPAVALSAGLSAAAHIACGGSHSAVLLDTKSATVHDDVQLRSAGAIWPNLLMCGDNADGQLGRPSGRNQFLDPHLALLDSADVHITLGAGTSFVWVLASKNKAASAASSSSSGEPGFMKPGFWACGRNDSGELGLPADAERPHVHNFTEISRLGVSDFGQTFASRFTIILSGTEDPEPKVAFRKDVFHELDRRLTAAQASNSVSQDEDDGEEEEDDGSDHSNENEEAKEGKHSPHPPLQAYHLEQHAVLALEMERLFTNQLMCDAAVRAGKPSTLIDGVVPSELHSRPHPRASLSTSASSEVLGQTSIARSPHGKDSALVTSSNNYHFDARLYPVHSAILECRCPRIAQLIHHENSRLHIASEGDHHHRIEFRAGSGWNWRTRMVRVELENVSEAAMPTFLQFLYSDREALIERFDADNLGILLDLAYAAHSYGLDRLLGLCQLRIAQILTTATAVPVLGQASNLGLLAIKRICLEFIRDNYEMTVSRRNRVAVEALNSNPALLAEVVGLTSADFATSLIDALPEPTIPYASVLVHDLGRLKEMASFADVEILPTAGMAPGFPSQHHDQTRSSSAASHAPISCHAIILAARCPALFDAIRAHLFGDISRKHDVSRDPMKSPFPLTEEHFFGSRAATVGPAQNSHPRELPGATQEGPMDLKRALHQGLGMLRGLMGQAVSSVAPAPHVADPAIAAAAAAAAAQRAQQLLQKDKQIAAFVQEMGSAHDALPRPRVASLSGETRRMQISEVTEASPKAIRVFLDYLYAASTKSVTPEIAIDILMMCHVYKLQDSALYRAAAEILLHNLEPSNVLDVLCVSTLIHDDALRDLALVYAVQHAKDCLLHNGDKLRDAIADFPDLGVALIHALAESSRH
ncbi:RCC1 and BTB domain-containing protein 2 [Hondaea fermentalgiana]|uniref:RCC1 and BTB domain-containing protein 2 n=1 Tax=Hondaea fermentalgiana TaxID=2315210 RepID=A0A2R5GRX2_9STRA|nr:RCC1 and BTB domain-containing protein 2 [Hondaea fermentalgiana]|eukprot:GBG31091.1 RCC1 and BTB domain-containing protein 2 [Hondaea fermentalgiana]